MNESERKGRGALELNGNGREHMSKGPETLGNAGKDKSEGREGRGRGARESEAKAGVVNAGGWRTERSEGGREGEAKVKARWRRASMKGGGQWRQK